MTFDLELPFGARASDPLTNVKIAYIFDGTRWAYGYYGARMGT